MPEFRGLSPSQQEWDSWTPEQRRKNIADRELAIFGQDEQGRPTFKRDKNGDPIPNSIPLNRNHLTALHAHLERTKNPQMEQIMAEHTAIVEENERAAAAKRAGR